MKNWLQYISLLGLLGFLGVFTPNTGFIGFFGFFGFINFRNIIFDERFEANVNKSCKNAFVLSIGLYAFITVLATLTAYPKFYAYAFPISFALQIITFSFSLQYYENHGRM
jgi:hypothetical protein